MLTEKANKADTLRQETQTKLDSEMKMKQSLADDFSKSMVELKSTEAKFSKKMKGDEEIESNLATKVALTQKELVEAKQELVNDKLVDKNLVTIYQEKLYKLKSESEQKIID